MFQISLYHCHLSGTSISFQICSIKMDTEEGSTSHKGLRIKSYTLKFKIDAVNFAKVHGNHAASRKYAINRRRIIEWRKQEDKL